MLIEWIAVLGCVQDLETKIIGEVVVAENAAEMTSKSSSMDLKCRLTCLFGISTPVIEMPIVGLYRRFLQHTDNFSYRNAHIAAGFAQKLAAS